MTWVIYLCFFLSGATALVYEVVWLRMLGLVFGHTVHAITTVLAAFMAGLGLGSLLFGGRAARLRNPLRVYGILEIGIGLLCASTPVLIWLTGALYPALHRVLIASYSTFSFIQFLVAFVVLLPPTTLMGGTLPVLSQALVGHRERIGSTVGSLYAVNTFGGVTGVVLAGYGLLPALGNQLTLWSAIAVNIVIGVAALACGRARPELPLNCEESLPAEPVPIAAPVPRQARLQVWMVAAALGVSGAVSMIYEVAWTRALALVIGSSTFAFTAILVAFLLGIAWGAAAYSVWWGRRAASSTTFALIQLGIGAATLLVVALFERLPELLLTGLGRSDASSSVALLELIVSAHALLPAAFLIGATFPCAVAVCATLAGRVGKDVGRLYAVNTVGAIVGAAVAGFVLVPVAGVHDSIKIGVFVNAATAIALLAASRPLRARRWLALGLSMAVAAAVFVVPRWNASVMSSGPAIYGKRYLEALAEAADSAPLRAYNVIFYRDGPSATVAVTRSGDHLALRVNGKVDASTGSADMPTQVLSGHLPLLLQPGAKRILVVGLGSGITAASVASHPIERLDVVEIEPGVIAASPLFAHLNRRVLEHPRVRTVVADARNFLVTTSDRYDVIISEPSNPWIGGVASLFTREFFELARQRLRPGGVMVQWLQAYSLRPDDLRMILRTFHAAFPAASLWHPTGADLLLVGRSDAAPIDLHTVKTAYESNPMVQADLRRIGHVGWAGVLGHFLLGEKDVARCAGAGPLNTDDRLPLEFSAPRALYLQTDGENLAMLQACRQAALPEITADSRSLLDPADVRNQVVMAMAASGDRENAERLLTMSWPPR